MLRTLLQVLVFVSITFQAARYEGITYTCMHVRAQVDTTAVYTINLNAARSSISKIVLHARPA